MTKWSNPSASTDENTCWYLVSYTITKPKRLTTYITVSFKTAPHSPGDQRPRATSELLALQQFLRCTHPACLFPLCGAYRSPVHTEELLHRSQGLPGTSHGSPTPPTALDTGVRYVLLAPVRPLQSGGSGLAVRWPMRSVGPVAVTAVAHWWVEGFPSWSLRHCRRMRMVSSERSS